MVEQHTANSDMAVTGGEHQCIPTTLIQRMYVGPQPGELLDESRVPSSARCHDCRASRINTHEVIDIANIEPIPNSVQVEHVAVQAHGGENLGLATHKSVFEELSVSHLVRSLLASSKGYKAR